MLYRGPVVQLHVFCTDLSPSVYHQVVVKMDNSVVYFCKFFLCAVYDRVI